MQWSARTNERLRAIIHRSLRVLVPGAILAGAGLMAFGPLLWPILGGGVVYPSAALVAGFAGLILTKAIDNVTGPVLNAVPGIRMQVVSSALLVGNVGLTIVLSLRYGAAGAIWGTVLAQVPIITVPYVLRARAEANRIEPA